MMNEQKCPYVISIDQSTQGTKAILFDYKGRLLERCDLSHRQIVNDEGWVSHDLEEIYGNTVAVIRKLLERAGAAPEEVACMGISNQRETSAIWDKVSGEPLTDAVVWQCSRAAQICERQQIREQADKIMQRTGLKLSPYFPAAKICWLLENVEGAREKARLHQICHGTIDSYLLYRLTGGKTYATDFSNASRTQLFDIFSLKWDEEICALFGIDPTNLPEVKDSNACFGYTDCDGIFKKPIPICGVLGDSHAALFGQDCRKMGMTKATYGTGSSIMMNIGEKAVLSRNGLVTSLAWGIDGKVEYVLEGNLNYTGAVITWLKDDMKLIINAGETEGLANQARKDDDLYLVPAFTGLGAPYWNSRAKASIIGMDRTTKRGELVRSALECIAYQITDVVKAMEEDSQQKIGKLQVDGGPTKNGYLMQFQSDIMGVTVEVPQIEELSGMGAAYMAGMALGLWDEAVYSNLKRVGYNPSMDLEKREKKYEGWKKAIQSVIV